MLFIKTVSLEFVLFLFVVVHCKGPPVLIGPFKPLYTVKEGQNVKLRCKFSGTDDSADNRTLTAWQKLPEGHYITDKYERFKMRNGRYLRIKKVKLEDRGTYACIAYNPFGKIKKEIQLVVQGARPPPDIHELKPRILENVFKNETAMSGEDVTFVCSALSKSHPEFHFLKWKSPKNVSNGSDPFEFVDFSKSKFREIREIAKQHTGQRQVYTHRLIVRNVTLADEAKYTCVVGNSAGYVSRHAFLTVLSQDASNSSIIRAPATKPPGIKPIPSTSTSALSKNARDSVVTTTKRPPRKCPIRPSKIPLIDDYPPKFKNPSKNRNRFMEYVEGQPIKLKCHANGEPPLNVTWLKNGKPLSSRARQSHLRSKGFVLNFAALTYNDGGTYTCNVRNTFCSIQRTFHVKVVGARPPPDIRELKPRILENVFKNETAMSGEDVTFVCSALSKSHPEFHFLKWKSPKNVSNGSDPFEFVDFSKSKFREIREIAKQHTGQRQVYTHRLIVSNVTLADEAKYTCVVGNSAGYVSRHAFLTVLSQEGYVSDEPYGGGIGEQSSATKAPRNSPRPQSEREILVEEVPLAALIGVPIAVLILLIGTIVWCYFMTRKHRSGQLRKGPEKDSPPQQEMKDLSPQFYPPRKEETRNVSFNVYVDYPNDRHRTCLTTEQQSRTRVKNASPHVKCDSPHGKCVVEQDPPLDGLIINNEPPRGHSNRTNHRKRHDREELEFNESSESAIKCSGV